MFKLLSFSSVIVLLQALKKCWILLEYLTLIMNTPVALGWQKWVKSVQCIYGGVVFSNKRCYGVESQNQSDTWGDFAIFQ